MRYTLPDAGVIFLCLILRKPKGRFFWFVYAKGIPKVTMFAVEMWFGAGDGVECGRSTGLCPLPLGVPRCVIHNKKMLERNFW